MYCSRTYELRNGKEAEQMKLSVVVPTIGRKILLETLNSLEATLSHECKTQSEVIICLNGILIPDYLVDLNQKYSFHLRFIEFEDFVVTAEESAFRAAKEATGEYVWILGDDDVLLQCGIDELIKEIYSGVPGIFFPVQQMTSDGRLLEGPPFLTSGAPARMCLADLAASSGIQMSLTGFGRLVVKRDLLDFNKWQKVLESTQPLFSHVVAYCVMIKEEILLGRSPIIQYRQSSYHEGSDENWRKAANLMGTTVMYPFTVGIAEQVNFLVEEKVWTQHQASFALVNERNQLFYLSDYILRVLMEQARVGWQDSSQLPSASDLIILRRYFTLYGRGNFDLFRQYETLIRSKQDHRKISISSIENLWNNLPTFNRESAFASGIVGWRSGLPIFGHPAGYISPLRLEDPHSLGFRIIDIQNVTTRTVLYSKNLDAIFEEPIKRRDLIELVRMADSGRMWPARRDDFVSIPAVYAPFTRGLIAITRKIPKRIRKIFLDLRLQG